MNINIKNNLNGVLNVYRVGVIAFNANVLPGSEGLWELINEQISIVRNRYKLEDINKLETIASTRQAYKKCGKDPNRYRPSADSLLRRIVKGNGLYKVNNIVDILNLISVKSGFSIGGYNKSAIIGEIVLDKGTAGDEYYGIGRGLLNIENLPVLRDEKGVFGSPTSDSERTMIDERTTSVLFVFFDFGKSNSLDNYLNETIALLKQFANADNINKEIVLFS